MTANTAQEPSRAGSLSLVGGALALDFCNTRSGTAGAQALEHLRTAEDVLSWAAHAGALDSGALAAARAALAADPAIGPALLAAALALRDAVRDAAAALAGGAPPEPAALDRLTAEHAHWLASARLVPGARGFAWVWSAERDPVAAALGPVALSAVELLREERPERIRICAGPDCGWLFRDTARSGARRWCDMAVCGNRAKARRFRARAAAPDEGRGGVAADGA